MGSHHEELRKACRQVANDTLWANPPILDAFKDSLAETYFSIAIDYEEFVLGQGRDPNLIVRAVNYLASVHAIPPMRSQTDWFQESLNVLLELACPNTMVSDEQELFFQDIEYGIALLRSEFENHSEFDVVDWLDKNILVPEGSVLKVRASDIENVLYFPLIWNAFEDAIIGAKALAIEGRTESLNLIKIETAVETLFQGNVVEMAEFVELLGRIRPRYVTDGELNDNFEFYFRPWEEAASQNLEWVLLGIRTSPEQIVFSLLSIAWRLRNNLFHGIKHISDLKDQNENFGAINQVLATFVNQWRALHGRS